MMSFLLNSTVALVFGLPLNVGAILLLYWNDGRYDTSNLARNADPADPARVDPRFGGKPISLSGTLTTTETVGDDLYLKPGDYLAVHRSVAMYAWSEHAEYPGRSGDAIVTYVTDWSPSPTPTANFKQPAGHLNPPMAVQNGDFHPPAATLGAYSLDLAKLEVPGSAPLPLNGDNTNLPAGGALIDGQALYVGRGTYLAPQVGDLLIRYDVVRSGVAVTAYGTPRGSTLQRYVGATGHELYGIYLGTPADAVHEMHGSYVTTLWFLRCAGFFLLWLGAFLVWRPLLAVLPVVPPLGGTANASVAAVTFIVALSIAIVAILVSAILHRLIAALRVVIGAGAVILGRHLPFRCLFNARRGHTTYWGKGFRR